MNKIYVGNLPVSIDSITLESLFALCGPILTSQIHKYVDTRNHEEVERAYGFITFKNHDSLAKAVYFHRKVYEGLVLIVHHADSYHYSTFLGGIPQHVKLDYITMFLQTHFGDRFYSNINYVPGKGPNGQGCLWVSFKDEETRRKYLNLTCLFFSTNSPNINENQKLLPRDTKEGDYVNIVILKVPDGTQNYQIKTMFQLCGQIGPSIQIPPTENSYTKTFLSITRSGYETARKFDNLKVKDWPVPIRVVPKEQHDDVLKAEYPHTVLMRNFDSNYSLKELEAKFFEGFGPDSVRLLKSKKDKSFIYVNCKDQSEKEKILNVSGKIYFGGAEPATFEPFEEMKKADSMESIASNASRIAKNRTSKGRKTVSPTLSTNSLQQQDEWRITVENIGADTNLMKLPQLFSKIGKVKNFTSGPNNSYIFQLTPNL